MFNAHDPQIKEEYLCPITKRIMLDPVLATDGYSYEKEAILQWFAENDTSPVTNERFENKLTMPNTMLKKSIQDFIQKHKRNYAHYISNLIFDSQRHYDSIICNQSYKPAATNLNEGDYNEIWDLERLGFDITKIHAEERKVEYTHGMTPAKEPKIQVWTLLHLAAYLGQTDKLEVLIRKGFDVGACNADLIIFFPEKLKYEIERLKNDIGYLKEQLVQLQDRQGYCFKYRQAIESESKELQRNIDRCQKNIYSFKEQLSYWGREKDYREIYWPEHYGSHPYNSERYQALSPQGTMKEYLQVAESDLRSYKEKLAANDDSKLQTEIEATQEKLKLFESELRIKQAEIGFKNDQTCESLTPLHLAVSQGHVDSVSFLINAKANLEMQDKQGRTPIFYAVIQDYPEVVRLLVERGANIAVRDQNGNSLIHVAAQYGSQKTIDLLIEMGFSNLLKNNLGKTPEQVALELQRDTIATHIKQQSEGFWESIPKRLVDHSRRIQSLEQKVADTDREKHLQEQRLNSLEKEMKLLQEQLARVLQTAIEEKNANSLSPNLAVAVPFAKLTLETGESSNSTVDSTPITSHIDLTH